MECVLLHISCHYKHMYVSYTLLPNIQYVQYLHKYKTNKKLKQNIEAKRVLWRPQLSYNRLVSWSISNTKRIARIRERERQKESGFARSFSGSVVEWTIVTLSGYIYTHLQGKQREIWIVSRYTCMHNIYRPRESVFLWIFPNTFFNFKLCLACSAH